RTQHSVNDQNTLCILKSRITQSNYFKIKIFKLFNFDPMRIIQFIYSFFILAGAFLLAACEENETDSTAPTIQIESPADHDTFTPGETLTFTAVFSDNIELYSYKIDVHHNSDG